MSIELATAYVSIVPTTRNIQARVARDIGGPLSRAGDDAGATAGRRYSAGFGKAAKLAMIGVGGVIGGAVAGLGAVLKTGFGEIKDASAGTAQLAAGIKSTGNAANVSVQGLNDLASSVQGYSGQTDDSIVKSEQLLLTFTNIRNAGPNKIFDLATKASADMAAKMGGDASGSAIRLGKALNDPVKGVAMLTKVGVSFTAGQKATIAAMVKTGDTVGAQKVILKELSTEFGGAAKAAGKSLPGQLSIAKRSFEDMSQGVMTAALPALTGLAKFAAHTLVPAIGKVVTFVTSRWPAVQHVIMKAWNGFIKPALMAWVNYAKWAINTVWKPLIAWFVSHWPQIQAVIVTAWTNYIQPAFKAIVDFVSTKLIPAIGTVVGFVVAHWPQIQAAFVTAWNAVKPVIMAWVGLIMSLWNSVLKPVVGWVVAHWPQIKTAMIVVFVAVVVAAKVWMVALRVVFNTVAFAVRALATVIRWLYTGIVAPIFRGIAAAVRVAIAAVKVSIDVGTGIVKGFAKAVGWISSAFKAAFDSVKHWIGNIVSFVTGLPGKVAGVAVAMLHVGGQIASALWTGLKTIVEKVGDIGKTIYNAVAGAINRDLIDKLKNWKFTIKALGFHHTFHPFDSLPEIPLLAQGGIIPATPGGMPFLGGEGGQPEAIIPLSKLRTMLGADTTNRRAAPSVTVVQNISNPVPEPVSTSGPAGIRRAALALGHP